MGVVGPAARGVWWVQEATEPNWEALEAFVVDDAADGIAVSDFMWMAEVLLSTGVVVQMYKHITTRRYLLLGDDDRAYFDSGGGCYLPHASRCDAVAGLELS